MNLIDDYLDQILALRDNPVGTQQLVYETMEAMSSGRYVMHDASNPVAFCIEAACATATAGMMRNETLHQRQHPHLARTDRDLYYNLSDVDLLYSFASPSRIDLPLLLSYKEIKNKAVAVDRHLSVLRIPKDTQIEVTGLVFTMMYPVDVRLYEHGGVQVVSDLSHPDPMHPMDTNHIQWKIITLPAEYNDETFPEKMLYLELPLKQMEVDVHYEQITESGGFSKLYEHPHRLAAVRVYYHDDVAERWIPVRVSFDQSYSVDQLVVTARRLREGVHLSIPRIFFKRKMVPRNLRVDVINTQGAVDVSLEKYHPNAYSAEWKDHDKKKDRRIQAVRELSSVTFFSDRALRGGHDGPSFNELKKRIIEGTVASRKTPIVESGVRRDLHDLGYRLKRTEDGVAKRLYAASRALPERPNDPLRLPLGSMIETYMTSVSGIPSTRYVHDHGDQVVFEEGTFFNMQDGVLSVMDDVARSQLMSGTLEEVVGKLRAAEFYYLPYHYVLDLRDTTTFDAYHLNSPKLVRKEFVAENPSTGLEMRSFDVGVSKVEDGYKVVVRTLVNDPIKEVMSENLHAQLSFTPEGEDHRLYMNGLVIGRDDEGAPIFEFHMPSQYRITDRSSIDLDGFERWGDGELSWSHLLTQEYDLFFFVSGNVVSGSQLSGIDMVKGDAFLPSLNRALIHERLEIQWGKRLDRLWSRCRSNVSKQEYLRYESDVPYTYTEDVLVKDPDTMLPRYTYTASGAVEYDILHHVGDPVIDEVTGDPVIKHAKGSIIVENGQPVVLRDRDIAYQMDVLLFVGEWYLATDAEDITYRKLVADRLSDWIDVDMNRIRPRLIENTDLVLRPTKTVGYTQAEGGAGATHAISNAQSLKIHLEVLPMIYKNPSFRKNIKETILGLIGEHLTMTDPDRRISRFDVKELTETIREEVGEGVEDVRIEGLGGDADVDVLVLYGNDEGISIKRVAAITGSGEITMKEDISFEWLIAE